MIAAFPSFDFLHASRQARNFMKGAESAFRGGDDTCPIRTTTAVSVRSFRVTTHGESNPLAK